MQWHYAIGNEPRGPVDTGEFDRLVAQGVIRADTLVWREGMSEWCPQGQLSAVSTPGEATAVATGAVCSECGRSVLPDQFVRLSGRPVCGACKPQVMQRLREGVVESGAEEVRRKHLNHEASLQAVGLLYLLGGTVGAVGSLGLVFASQRAGVSSLVLGVFLLVLAAAQFVVGIGLRRLRSWARVPAILFSALGLLGFPIGTLISAYILYLLLSSKGAMVFSQDYQRIREATPHIRYRTSVVVWIALGLLLLLLGVILFAAVAG